MLEDLKTLIQEFDIQALINPASAEQFLMNLILLAAMIGLVVLAWMIIRQVLGG